MQCSQTLSVISSTDWEKNHWSDETSPAFWVWARFAGSIFILPNTARSWNSVGEEPKYMTARNPSPLYFVNHWILCGCDNIPRESERGMELWVLGEIKQGGAAVFMPSRPPGKLNNYILPTVLPMPGKIFRFVQPKISAAVPHPPPPSA